MPNVDYVQLLLDNADKMLAERGTIDWLECMIINSHAYHDAKHTLPWSDCDSPDCRIARGFEKRRNALNRCNI